jgi:hypothetical protein
LGVDTVIAGLVSQLIAAGVAPELAATVVTEAFVAGATSTGIPRTSAHEKRKEYDRERKRKERMSTGIPPDSTGHADTALTLSSLKDNSIKKEKKVRARKSELSTDWAPSDNHFSSAEKLGIPRAAVLNKAEDMRLWAKSTGAVKVDWDATFHGFLRRDAHKLTGATYAKPPNGLAGALARLRDDIAADERSQEGGRPALRLLPGGGRE